MPNFGNATKTKETRIGDVGRPDTRNIESSRYNPRGLFGLATLFMVAVTGYALMVQVLGMILG